MFVGEIAEYAFVLPFFYDGFVEFVGDLLGKAGRGAAFEYADAVEADVFFHDTDEVQNDAVYAVLVGEFQFGNLGEVCGSDQVFPDLVEQRVDVFIEKARRSARNAL